MDKPASKDKLINAALEALDRAPPREDAPPEPPGILSVVLSRLDERRRPRPATVCETCPNSVWFTSPKEVKCYCRVMYLITWSTGDPNQITSCDGVYLQ